jgi:hypothetical protein
MTINIYGADRPTAQVMELTRRLLENYAGATNVEMTVHQIC